MEQETLFTASKWEILKLLESGPSSPIELASLSRTSVANVSQQLRLLEMAGLVTSYRVPNRDKGQPRILYKLAGNNCYIISASRSLVEKKLHKLSIPNKIILKIWFYPDETIRYFLEKGFWQIDYLLPKLQALGVKDTAEGLKYYLVTEQKLPELSPVTVTNHEGISKRLVFLVVDPSKLSYEIYPLYDPQQLLGGVGD